MPVQFVDVAAVALEQLGELPILDASLTVLEPDAVVDCDTLFTQRPVIVQLEVVSIPV